MFHVVQVWGYNEYLNPIVAVFDTETDARQWFNSLIGPHRPKDVRVYLQDSLGHSLDRWFAK
jgi:hypothetical protein